MTPIEILKKYQAEYDKEYKTKEPQVVTTKVDECDGTIYRRVRMTDKMTMMRDGYEECNEKTYERYVETIRPRKFYSETEAMMFVKYIRRIAGRTVTDDEMNMLLHTVTSGRQYELICLVNRTEELREWHKWRR